MDNDFIIPNAKAVPDKVVEGKTVFVPAARHTIKSRQALPRETYTPDQVAKYKTELRAYRDAVKSGEWEKRPYNEFLSIVTQRPDDSLSHKKPKCPKCQSDKVTNHGGTSTLVGGGPEYDPNHHWNSMSCECGFEWTMEYNGRYPKEGEKGPVYNVWHTLNVGGCRGDDKVLAGIPTCYENYVYTCSKCGGDVHRHYYDNGTRNKAAILSRNMDGSGKRSYETWFKCGSCGVEVESTTDYYSESNPHRPRKPTPPKLRLGWRIIEKPSIVVVNDFAISRVDFGESE